MPIWTLATVFVEKFIGKWGNSIKVAAKIAIKTATKISTKVLVVNPTSEN